MATIGWWATPSGARVVPQATADLVNADGADLGTVTFLGRGRHATEVRVEIALPLPEGDAGLNAFHGLHIHATGLCEAPFTTAGGHWDEGGHTHGAHLGDLPSILVGDDGQATLSAAVPRFDVDEVVGRAVVLHVGRDNFGNVPSAYSGSSAAQLATQNTGDAGGRYGCGVIEAAGR